MKRIALLVTLVALAAVSSLSAQVASNTKLVTGGIFKQDADNIVDPYNFVQVKKGTWTLSLGTDQKLTGANGNLFGSLYWGNAFAFAGLTTTGSANGTSNNEIQTSATTNNFDGTTYAYIGKSVTTADYKKWTESSNNLFTTLVGFGGLGSLTAGISYQPNKVYGDYQGFAYSLPQYKSANNNNLVVNTTTNTVTTATGTDTKFLSTYAYIFDGAGSTATKTYDVSGNLHTETGTKYDLGSLDTSATTGMLAYGNSWSLGGLTLKSKLGATVASYANTGVAGYTTYNKSYNTGLPNNTSYSKVFSSQYNGNALILAPVATIALDTPLDKATLTAQLDYSLALPIYANSYNDTTGASQTGGVASYATTTQTTLTSTSGVLSQVVATTREWVNDNVSASTNTITPKLQYKVPLSDAFNFGISYAPVITLANESHQLSLGKVVSTTTTNNLAQVTAADNTAVQTIAASGYTRTINTFTWTNPLQLAGQFVAIPSLLSFNAGVAVALPAFMSVTQTESNNGVKSDSTVTTTVGGTVTKTAATNTVQGNSFTNNYTDSQANQNSIAATTAILSLGAVYNLTADTYADIMIVTNSNVVWGSTFIVQLTSRY